MPGGLKLELSPDAVVTAAALTSVVAVLAAQMPEPQLRLDDARQSDADATDRPTSGQADDTVAWMGPFAGLLLGLLLAAPRELGGDRMRSSRDVKRALGAPVLGAIPTLSAKARSAYLGSSAATRAATQLA
jgi:capsular polysaccharide biosynthesis protein